MPKQRRSEPLRAMSQVPLLALPWLGAAGAPLAQCLSEFFFRAWCATCIGAVLSRVVAVVNPGCSTGLRAGRRHAAGGHKESRHDEWWGDCTTHGTHGECERQHMCVCVCVCVHDTPVESAGGG